MASVLTNYTAKGIILNFPLSSLEISCKNVKVTHFECPCIENGCKSERGWEMHEEYMSSGIGHSDDARQVLYLIIPGFTEHTSKLKVDFQIDCETDKCHFILQSVSCVTLCSTFSTKLQSCSFQNFARVFDMIMCS